MLFLECRSFCGQHFFSASSVDISCFDASRLKDILFYLLGEFEFRALYCSREFDVNRTVISCDGLVQSCFIYCPISYRLRVFSFQLSLFRMLQNWCFDRSESLAFVVRSRVFQSSSVVFSMAQLKDFIYSLFSTVC